MLLISGPFYIQNTWNSCWVQFIQAYIAASASRGEATDSDHNYRSRRKTSKFPPLPVCMSTTLPRLVVTWICLNCRVNRRGTSRFFLGLVTSTNGETLVFLNTSTVPLFVRATELHMDATFRSTPLGYYQVASLHMISFGMVGSIFQKNSKDHYNMIKLFCRPLTLGCL